MVIPDMERISFCWAMLRNNGKNIILLGNDKAEALRFSCDKMNSPSLLPLMEELVEVAEDGCSYTVIFKNLSANSIIQKIKSYAEYSGRPVAHKTRRSRGEF